MSSQSGNNHINQTLGVRKPWSDTAFDHIKYSYENNGLPGALWPCAWEGGVASRPTCTGPPLRDTEVSGLSLCPFILPTRKAHRAKTGTEDPSLDSQKG